MAGRTAVMGQTGKRVLSDDVVQYKLSQKRTLRYQYTRVKHGWIAWVCGPFHSPAYGACGFGTKKTSAKAAMRDNLARNYRYIGNVLFSDVDEADNVGRVDTRLLEQNARPIPITISL